MINKVLSKIIFHIYALKERIFRSLFIRDSFWALTGNTLGSGLSLIAGIFVARYLGKDIYGEYGIIKNTIISLSIFSTFGLGYTSTKYVAEYKETRPEFLDLIIRYSKFISLTVSGLVALSLFIFAKTLSEQILDAPHLYKSIRVVSVWVVIRSLTTTQIGVMAGFGQFKKMAYIEGIVGVLTFTLSILFTYEWGLLGALFALLIAQIINLILNYQVVLKLKPKSKALTNNIPILKDIISFSAPIALQEITYSVMSWILHLMLIKITNYGELGLFSAAMQWNALILFIPGVLRNVLLSHLSSNSNNDITHNRILKNALLINFIATFIPVLVIYFFSNFIIHIYGNSFIDLRKVLQVSVFSTMFISLSNVYSQAYLSKGKSWLMFYIRFFRDFGMIALGYILLTYSKTLGGAISLAYSQLVASIFFLCVMAIIYKNIRQFSKT
ncbi:oligosaccharide flippase family protein [Bacteroidales bacterium MB20-C3-3]|nr:oligosaccharide flippase family protein [Bacteroidales bacterium MB20-C3-3]